MSTQQRIETESHKDPNTLEREIEQKRTEIDGIVHALENKLSPGQMFDKMLGYAKGNGGELMTKLGDSIKANPLAVLLTSVGIAWLMSGRQPAMSHASHSYAQRDDAWRAEAYGSPTADGDSEGGGMHLKERAGDLKDKAAHMRDSVYDTMHGARERLGDMRHSVGDRAHHASEAVRESAHHARQTYEQMMREQPLAVAAVGIAAGALLGALLPPTRQEDQWIGRSSDQVKQRGREFAEQGLDRARHELEARGEGASDGSSTMSSGTGRSQSTASQSSSSMGSRSSASAAGAHSGGSPSDTAGTRSAGPVPPPRSH